MQKTTQLLLPCVFCHNALALSLQSYVITKQQGVTTASIPPGHGGSDDLAIDYLNAKPMPLPRPERKIAEKTRVSTTKAEPQSTKSGISPGSKGSGQELPTRLPLSQELNQYIDRDTEGSTDVKPLDYGVSNHPFSTARVANELTHTKQDKSYKSYPYRASGKLFFTYLGGTATCSAALIQPGVVVTAAHCVMAFGSLNGFYADWVFIPAYHKGKTPFGKWYAHNVTVKSSYADGSDPCIVSGVVCENDVALLAVANRNFVLAF